MSREAVVREAWARLEGVLNEQGFELVEVEFSGSGRHSTLRLYVDRIGGQRGVTLDDCQAVSQMVSPVLDREDFVEGSYVLEVSSPGFDRPLRKPRDYERFSGEKVRVKTVTPVGGRRQFAGLLRGYRDGLVLVECDDAVHEIHIENVLKANLER